MVPRSGLTAGITEGGPETPRPNKQCISVVLVGVAGYRDDKYPTPEADRLCGLAVRHSPRDWEVRDSIPDRVKPRTLKLVSAADSPSVWHYGFSAKFGRRHDSVTGCGVRKRYLHHRVAARFQLSPALSLR
ncbi:hypothetical protein ElyMa_003032500 [Elysia marginata]|uniref:Uncharacterized protein n=1 Tax=Elysia marginata TaxID=1093978 RepID=A0AAV4IK54_9GAST|nr:hypothetical protein ElyMa_003032500 [Elysia marginata]